MLFAWFLKWRIALLTVLGYLAAGAVAYVTGRASWGHIVHVGHMVGEPSAAWLPVAVDGMVIAGVVMSGVDRIRGYRSRPWAVAAIWLGSTLTLAFNVISAIERGPYAMGVAVIYAVTFVFTIETMTHPSKRLLLAIAAPVSTVSAVAPTVPVTDPEPVAVMEHVTSATLTEPEPAQQAQTAIEATIIEPAPRNRRRARQPSYPGQGATDAELDAMQEAFRGALAPAFAEPVPVD